MENASNGTDLGKLISMLSGNPSALNALINALSAGTAEKNNDPQISRHEGSGLDLSALSALLSVASSGKASERDPRSYGERASSNDGNYRDQDRDCCNTARQNHSSHPQKLFGDKNEAENRIRLLNALRPYMCEERREIIDMLLKLLRIAELGELRGILGKL